MTTQPKTSGSSTHGRFVSVRSIEHPKLTHAIIISCDGGNVTFQHGMTVDQARELAGYLLAEAAYVEGLATQQPEDVAA